MTVLSVNVNKIAVLRNSRGGEEPSVVLDKVLGGTGNFGYNAATGDYEEGSVTVSQVAASMEATPAFQKAVADLILATKHTAPARSLEEMLLLDLDIQVLGASEETYQRYEDNIRREYSWVPMDIYREKRTEILQMFLDRPFIFMTEVMHDAYEAQARKNLARAIKALA